MPEEKKGRGKRGEGRISKQMKEQYAFLLRASFPQMEEFINDKEIPFIEKVPFLVHLSNKLVPNAKEKPEEASIEVKDKKIKITFG